MAIVSAVAPKQSTPASSRAGGTQPFSGPIAGPSAAPSKPTARAPQSSAGTSRGGGGAGGGGGGKFGPSRKFNGPKKFDPSKPKPEAKILFQTFFKSVGPRTYAAQVKELANGNQMIVLTEGKRDEATNEVRKTRLFVFSEDFDAFTKMMRETVEFTRAHPMSNEMKAKRAKYWAKQNQNPAVPSPTR